jgi:hypothetical protein
VRGRRPHRRPIAAKLMPASPIRAGYCGHRSPTAAAMPESPSATTDPSARHQARPAMFAGHHEICRPPSDRDLEAPTKCQASATQRCVTDSPGHREQSPYGANENAQPPEPTESIRLPALPGEQPASRPSAAPRDAVWVAIMTAVRSPCAAPPRSPQAAASHAGARPFKTSTAATGSHVGSQFGLREVRRR